MSLGKNNNVNLSDFSDIFGGLKSQTYQVNDISDDRLKLYKEAYIKFKEKFNESQANMTLDMETNTLNLNKFDGIDMFHFGVMLGLMEVKDESNNN